MHFMFKCNGNMCGVEGGGSENNVWKSKEYCMFNFT